MQEINTRLDAALKALAEGRPVIVVDDLDRENEGDLVISGQMANVENLVFCMKHARGLMCLPTTTEVLDRLQLPIMVEKTTDPFETPFTISADAATTSTGMSVHDRLKTIGVLLDENSGPEHLKRPGHMFPLRARDGLLKERKGHTEASVELVKMIGHKPVAVIIEIVNDDGTMAKGDDLVKFAQTHDLPMVDIKEIYDAVYNKSLQHVQL